jgi:serine/threonine protein kinase
LQTLINDGL